MYTVHVSKNILLDVKFQPGIVWVIEKYNSKATDPNGPLVSMEGRSSTRSIGFSTGETLRYNFARSWTAMLLSDYNSARSSVFLIEEDQLKSITTNVGIAFRF